VEESQIYFARTNRLKFAVGIAIVWIAVAFVLAHSNPDHLLTQLATLFPLGFANYLVLPIIFPGHANSAIHYLLVGCLGFIAGLFIHFPLTLSKWSRKILIAALMANSCGFTVYVLASLLAD
jgi:hypothetical protein